MNIRLTQIDGSLPNIVLMRLAQYCRSRGDYVELTRRIDMDLFEPEWDMVLASCIFSHNKDRLDHFKEQLSAVPVQVTHPCMNQ